MQQLIDRISIGAPITRALVTLHPLYLHQDPVLAVSAQRAGVGLAELPTPTVPVVQVVNPGDRPALLTAGTILRGGLQTRMVTSSVLLPGHAPVELPVSCIERGRWDGGARFELTSTVAPRRVRRTSETTLHRNLGEGRRTADQGAVWDTVEHELGDDRNANPTRNLAASADARADDRRAAAVRELTDRGPLPHQSGLLVSHGGRIVGAELFGNPELLADLWAGIVSSYVANSPERVHGRPSTTQALTFLRHYLTRDAHRSDGVAIGREYRVSTDRLAGTGLMVDDQLVHASCFVLAA
jgi:hypothetical protein